MIKKKNLLIVLAIILLFSIAGPKQVKKEAEVDQTIFNGNMEDWCVNTDGTPDRSYGFLNEGPTQCDDTNSVVIDGIYDPLTDNMNKMPLWWKQYYGCCVDRTTDAFNGTYAALIHKETTNDWYGFGLTNRDRGTFIPAVGGAVYTVSFYYKATTTEGRSLGEGGGFHVYFYDALGNTITNYGSSLPDTPIYTEYTITAPSPFEAVEMGWDIWVPVDSKIDFYLDEVRIDERPCETGETISCGIDIGECQAGLRTCTAGVWSDCVGEIQPVDEICGDSLDNNCDGQSDEFCEIKGSLTASEKISYFDVIDAATYNHLGYAEKDGPTWWAWDNAPIVEAQVNMYTFTGDTLYLDYVIANTDHLISVAADFDSNGLLDWEGLESPIDPILTYSRNLFPMIKFAYVIERDGLGEPYASKADEYMAFVVDNFIPLYDGMWYECGDMGFWAECTHDDFPPYECLNDPHSAPNNRVSFVARIYAYLYALTGDQEYYNKIERFGKKVKSTFWLRNDGPSGAPYYFWNYNNKAGCRTIPRGDGGSDWVCDFDCAIDMDDWCEVDCKGGCCDDPSEPDGIIGDCWSCQGPMEIGYSNFDMTAIMDLYELGVVFTSSDINLLANTFKEGFLYENAQIYGVPTPIVGWAASTDRPENHADFYAYGHNLQHWSRFGQYDSHLEAVYQEMAEWIMIDNDYFGDGNNYNFPYICYEDLAGTTGEVCAIEENNGKRSHPADKLVLLSHMLLQDEGIQVLADTPPTDQCTGVPCNDYCSGDTLYYSGSCTSGSCNYLQTTCANGCNETSATCIGETPPSDTPTTGFKLEDNLPLIIIGGGFLMFMFAFGGGGRKR